MSEATFRFYAELNTFLANNRRFTGFPFPFADRVSVKHALESLGVPHTEVDLIIVNGESVDFSYILRDQDEELAAISITDQRILLTRDTALLKRKAVTHGSYCAADVGVDTSVGSCSWLFIDCIIMAMLIFIVAASSVFPCPSARVKAWL